MYQAFFSLLLLSLLFIFKILISFPNRSGHYISLPMFLDQWQIFKMLANYSWCFNNIFFFFFFTNRHLRHRGIWSSQRFWFWFGSAHDTNKQNTPFLPALKWVIMLLFAAEIENSACSRDIKTLSPSTEHWSQQSAVHQDDFRAQVFAKINFERNQFSFLPLLQPNVYTLFG